MKTDELREKYLAFFETKGCVRRPSDVLVPRWDPSVLFTPAGMNQFKDHFLGRCKLDFTRATTCQKCLRTGDIDNVGRTAYHHTFFEMLGNFSFGDYFKREAINWAWEFLTSKKWLGLAPERLSATIYLDDDEAAGIWTADIKLPPERLQRLGEDENFWPANAPSQGPDGVCGPCSEIYYHTPTGAVEIWNLVFTQFNRVGDPPNNLRPLPSKNIDTGMGLERTAAVLQGVESNFHIDILRGLVDTAGEVCGVRYDPADENGRRLRRIADHVRACAFAIHENVYPGNKKQGYVIRRLLRRAVLDGRQMGVREPFLHKLVGKVAELMHHPYPELGETIGRVAGVIEKEEANFLSTVDAGLDRIERVFAQMKKERRGVVAGAEAADMFQTHGFPPELFETLAAERNLAFDWKGFHEEMEKHGIESGGGQKIEVFRHDPLEALKKAMHGSRFVGYETLEIDDAKVVGIIASDQLCDQIDEVDHEHPIVVLLDKTPFYGEMGGQVGDTGVIAGPGFHFEVIDTQVDGGLHAPSRSSPRGADRIGGHGNRPRRCRAPAGHPPRPFGHPLVAFRLAKAPRQARPSAGLESGRRPAKVRLCQPVVSGQRRPGPHRDRSERQDSGRRSHRLPKSAAGRGPQGRRHHALRRKVSRRGANGNDGRFQQGTVRRHPSGSHRASGIAKDYRRGERGRRHTAHYRPDGPGGDGERPPHAGHVEPRGRRAAGAAGRAARPPRSPDERAAPTEEATGGRPQRGAASVDQLLKQAADVGGVKVVIAEVPGGPNDLRQLIDQLRRKAAPVAVLLANRQEEEQKVTLIAGLSRDLVDRGLDAVAWVRVAANIVGGSGGGRPDMAQAGGKLPDKLPDALEAARGEIERLLSL